MEYSAENLRFILGLKLKQLRQKRNLSLKELADGTGLSISFLSEIEKGKKYPKPEKMMQIAAALKVGFDDLVSLKVDKELGHITSLLKSPFLREFPFDFFGITPRDLVDLMTNTPGKAGAFVRTFLEIGETYDMRVEHFLLATLRSYQQLNCNYFGDIEDHVDRFTAGVGWVDEPTISYEKLKLFFEKEYAATIEESSLEKFPALRPLRSIWVEGAKPKLVINSSLLPSQKAFVVGREIGFNYLDLKERATTSSWIKVESFEQVLNNFQASYFAGALLINRQLLRHDLAAFFESETWDSARFVQMMQRYRATPEMFLYRLSQLIPHFFGLNDIYYLRFNNVAGTDEFRMTKDLNMTNGVVPHGLGLNEHYCRRWQSITLLKDLAQRQESDENPDVLAGARILNLMATSTEFFAITLARPLALKAGTNSSISLGFLMNRKFKSVVKFWQDTKIMRGNVHETCERCGLSQEECSDRAAPPEIYQKALKQRNRKDELAAFLKQAGGVST